MSQLIPSTRRNFGFDMFPRLSTSVADTSRWNAFLNEVEAKFQKDRNVVVKVNVIEFLVAQHPCLPIAGHKFLRFSSKAQGDAEPYIQKVRGIARKHFGDRVKFWHELAEDYGCYRWSQVNASIATYFSPVSP